MTQNILCPTKQQLDFLDWELGLFSTSASVRFSPRTVTGMENPCLLLPFILPHSM